MPMAVVSFINYIISSELEVVSTALTYDSPSISYLLFCIPGVISCTKLIVSICSSGGGRGVLCICSTPLWCNLLLLQWLPFYVSLCVIG